MMIEIGEKLGMTVIVYIVAWFLIMGVRILAEVEKSK